MKVCKTCAINQPVSSYYIKDKKNMRYDTTCKDCRKISAKKWHVDNRDKSVENKKKWHNKNREIVITSMRDMYHKDIHTQRKLRKEWRKQNPDKVKEWNRVAYKKHKPKILAQKKIYEKKNRDKINAYKRMRYKTDFGYRMEITNRRRMREALKGKLKEEHSKEYLGCSFSRWCAS